MGLLKGKEIVIGVTGCIAAYKSADLVRLVVKNGGQVHVIMTRNARKFIAPLTFQTLSGNPVTTNLFDLYEEKEIGHISLARRADILAIAPATANIVGKIANGIADDMLSTVVMATKSPVLFAPAMNVNMWENRILQKNIKELQSLGYFFVDPGYGALACGEYGKGRFADPENILDEMISIMSQKDFSGRRVLVTAGPTREPIDPVRFISNPSSGKMGFSIARALIRRGAAVKLISGPTYLSPPRNVDFISVATAKEMASAVWDNFEWSDIVIMTSAVADFRPRKAESQKIKKNDHCLVLEMEKTSDILKTIGKKKGKRIIVGFAAETNDLIANAVVKLKKKKLDMIVANDVSTTDIGFGSEQNKVKIILSDGSIEDVPKMEKDEVAEKILDKIAYLVAKRKALF